MKFSSALPVLAAASSAYASLNPLIQARQAHAHRALIDVCAAIDADLSIASILQDGKPLVTGHLDVCLCVSVLPTFIQVNAAAQAAVLLLGETEVTALIEALINAAPGHQSCHYPDHATALCDAQAPCGFTCCDGYVPFPANNPTQCVCEAPNTECNGKCGSFPHGCGSQTPSRRRNLMPRCEDDQELCPVPGSKSKRGVECVHTKRDAESCGGCVAGPLSKRGVNCLSLPHVAKASCDGGECKILACVDAYVLDVAANVCVAVAAKRDVVADVVAAADAEVGGLVDVEALAGAVAVVDKRDVVADVVAKVDATVGGLVHVDALGDVFAAVN